MNPADKPHPDSLLDELAGGEARVSTAESAPPPRPSRDLTKMMRRIPVSVSLEVGTTQLSLEELLSIEHDSVIELDTIAGEPLTIKVNGTPIGRAEVVVSGENYGLRVTELSDLDVDLFDR